MYRVGIIGCGKPRGADGATGFGMSRAHAAGYRKAENAQIVALADIDLNNARAFQDDFGGDAIYADYREMLANENLDIVSIATWPHLHAEMVVAAAESSVKAVHCEKPMAPSYGESMRMVEACQRYSVQLTFNHQRRFAAPFRKARDMLRNGEIGDLLRVEAACPNLYDWGTHWFDMMFFFVDQSRAEWVIGQIDVRNGQTIFGVPIEGHGISHIKFADGAHGLLLTGVGASGTNMRLVGTDGVIDIGHSAETPLRIHGCHDTGWRVVECGEGIHGNELVERAILDLIDALDAGREPELSGQRALQATELIFATYESSRCRARIDLPLTIEDSPLQALLDEQG